MPMGFKISRNLRSYINHNLPFLLFGVYPLFFSEHRGVLVILLIIQVIFMLIKSPKLSFHKLFFVNSALYILYIIVYLFLSQDKSTIKVFETRRRIFNWKTKQKLLFVKTTFMGVQQRLFLFPKRNFFNSFVF